MKQARNIPVLVAAALAAAACGGGHSPSATAPPPASGPLTIGALADMSVPQDTPVGPVSVLATEGQPLATSAFTLTATSSDTTLLPPGSIQVGTASGFQAVTLTPADGAIGRGDGRRVLQGLPDLLHGARR